MASPDVNDSLVDSSFVTLRDFSEELIRDIAHKLIDFGVAIILDGKPAGSGVLAEIDGVRGILTAEHVIYNPFGIPFDNSASSSQVLSLPLTSYDLSSLPSAPWTDTAQIKIKYLSWYPPVRTVSDYTDLGPDLAFIPLPVGSPILEQLVKKKSFYNLSKDPERRMEMALQDNTFLAVVGCPAEWITYEPQKQPDQLTGQIGLGVFLTDRRSYLPDVGGYDYIDMEGDRNNAPKMPTSFGGVSGGALWTFSVSWDGPGKPETLNMCDYVFGRCRLLGKLGKPGETPD